MSENKNMPRVEISDELLSAFLDAELDETQMEQIRQCIAEDESIANRVAELSLVDELLTEQYSKINHQPLPTELQNMLDQLPDNELPEQAAQVVTFPDSEKKRAPFKQHLAMVASVALVAGIGLTQLFSLTGNNETTNLAEQNWSQVSDFLNTEPSSKTLSLNTYQLQAKLSFTDKAGHFCRQFELVSQTQVQNNIACKVAGQWQLAASFYQNKTDVAEYQTATATGAVRQTVDAMAQGPFLNKQQEQVAINNHWQAINSGEH